MIKFGYLRTEEKSEVSKYMSAKNGVVIKIRISNKIKRSLLDKTCLEFTDEILYWLHYDMDHD